MALLFDLNKYSKTQREIMNAVQYTELKDEINALRLEVELLKRLLAEETKDRYDLYAKVKELTAA